MNAEETQVAKDTILRAWKDEEYRQSLPEEARDAIPARPVSEDGRMLTDEELEAAAGGLTPGTVVIAGAAAKAAGLGVVGGAAGWGISRALPD